MNDFSSRLKLLRKNDNITQKYIADDLGVSKQLIGSWESKKCEPSIDMLIAIADYFMITVGQLVGTEQLQL